MQCVCSVARCSNKVYQCWDHEGRLFTATLNTQCRLFSLLRAIGIASVSLSFSSICLPHSPVLPLRLPNYLSALPPVSYLSLSFPHRLSFHLLPPLFFSRLFCFLRVTSVYVCLSLCHSPLQSVRADISGSLRQVVRRGLTRLREIRDEKRSVRVTIRVNLSDTSCDVLKVVRTRRTHSARSRLLTGK